MTLPLTKPGAVSAWPPTPGMYRTRMVRGGPWVPVKIWFGLPLDPITGEELDRSPRWQALRNGEDVAVESVWPAGEPITEAEYNYLLSVRRWAVKHASHEPEANPMSPINVRTIPAILPPRRTA